MRTPRRADLGVELSRHGRAIREQQRKITRTPVNMKSIPEFAAWQFIGDWVLPPGTSTVGYAVWRLTDPDYPFPGDEFKRVTTTGGAGTGIESRGRKGFVDGPASFSFDTASVDGPIYCFAGNSAAAFDGVLPTLDGSIGVFPLGPSIKFTAGTTLPLGTEEYTGTVLITMYLRADAADFATPV